MEDAHATGIEHGSGFDLVVLADVSGKLLSVVFLGVVGGVTSKSGCHIAGSMSSMERRSCCVVLGLSASRDPSRVCVSGSSNSVQVGPYSQHVLCL